MKRIWKLPHWILLYLLSALTYGPFFWARGYYWDEAPWTWIYFRLGPEALTRTFSTSRPFWGMLYQLTLPIFGPEPWIWHLALVFVRGLSAFLVYKVLTLIWNDRPFVTRSASILFLVYPGLGQNFLGLMYTHFYIVLCLFLASFLFTGKAIQSKKPSLHIFGVILSIANILMMEYFYFLELLRPLFIWGLFKDDPKRVRKAVIHSSVYFSAFVLVSLWRLFFFSNQNASYSYGTLEALKTSPIAGIIGLTKMMALAFWNTTMVVWVRAVEIFNVSSTGLFTLIGALVIGVLIGSVAYLAIPRTTNIPTRINDLAISLLIWLFSGGAFWLVGIRTLPELHFSADRFTMPFMIASSLFFAFALNALRSPAIRNGFLVLIIGLAGAYQFTVDRTYVQDKITQDRFFSQLIARVPSITPGTTIITNDLPVTYYSDNSLSGTLNWIYSRPGEMDTILYFASVRFQEGRALGTDLEPNTPFEQNYLARVFQGNTSQMLVFEYSPPGCLRLLDPELDPLNKLLPPELRDAASLSDPTLISTDRRTLVPPHITIRTDPWCEIYQTASLSAYQADWNNVTDLYQSAIKQNLSPQAPMEKLIFIEAFAHTGDLSTAAKLSDETRAYSKNYTTPPLCALWERIVNTAKLTGEQTRRVNEIVSELKCGKN